MDSVLVPTELVRCIVRVYLSCLVIINSQLVSLSVRSEQAIPPSSFDSAMYVTVTLSMGGEYTPVLVVPYYREICKATCVVLGGITWWQHSLL